MANKPFDREVWNPLEASLSGDNNLASSYGDQALRDFLNKFSNIRVSAVSDVPQSVPITSFIGEGFKLRPTSPPSYQVEITAGTGLFGDNTTSSNIGGVSGVNDLSTLKPLLLNTKITLPLSANATAFQRIDLIEVKANSALTDVTARQVLNPATGIFAAANVNKTFSWALDGLAIGTVITPAPSTTPLGYKVGIASGAPAIPTTTTGYVAVGFILTSPGSPPILGYAGGNPDLFDQRAVFSPSGQHRVNLTVSVDPATGTVTILEFDGPPGINVPQVTSNPQVGNVLAVTVRLEGSGALPALVNTNRITAVAQIVNASITVFPVVTLKAFSINAGTNNIIVTFQSIQETIAAGALTLPLTAHTNPTVYRISINYW